MLLPFIPTKYNLAYNNLVANNCETYIDTFYAKWILTYRLYLYRMPDCGETLVTWTADAECAADRRENGRDTLRRLGVRPHWPPALAPEPARAEKVAKMHVQIH